MRSRWLPILGYIVGGICLLVGVFELGLRAGLGLGTPPLFQADSTIGYVFQANQDTYRFTNRVYINRYHQRSDDLKTRADSTFTRILFLGDSVMWGGVLTDQSETIPEATEEEIARQCERPVEALNASAGSWGIGNLAAYVERFGLFGSDIVVLQIGTHDLTQPPSTADVVGRHPSYPSENPTSAIGELWKRYLWPRMKPYVPEMSEETPADGSVSAARSASPETRLARNLDRLRQIVEGMREQRIPVVIVHTPNRGQVAGKTNGPSPSVQRRQFLTIADSLDVPVLNLAQAWAQRPGVNAFYRDHVHFNVRGNNAVADTLARFLKAHVQSLCTGSDF